MTSETATRPEQQQLDWQQLLNTALTTPGSFGNEYSRFHQYSFLNQVLLLSQECPVEPIATYKRWQALGRHVLKGSKAFEIVRPIIVKREDDNGDEQQFRRFKRVKAIFPVSMTDGDELPPAPALPDWDVDRALSTLDIKRVPFSLYDGNVAGYSTGREVAVSPVATHPTKTLLHEVSHIVSGHTSPERLGEYQQHRGRFELEAEAPAYLVSKQLEIATEQEDSSSRAYIQNWLRGDKPSDESVRTIFKTTETILSAGRLAVEATS